uniref:PAT1 homolog 2 n=2 Tax=Scophthalmus maximus TaxID=52904 RepID=A0A8D3B4H4_SCOMX
MSESEQKQEAGEVSGPQWPENGGEWSDGEDGTNMDCGLLQAMAEEDEEINVHNEETFGTDLDAQGTTEDPSSGLLQFVEPLPPPPPPAPPTPPLPDPKPPSRHSSPSPPRQKPQCLPRTPLRQRGRGRGYRGGLDRGQMFEDPAVMRIVEGRPNLKTLDSAIVDCGNTVCHEPFEEDWMAPSYSKTRRISGSLLQDSAIVCVIDGHRGRGQHLTSNVLDLPYPVSSFRGSRGEPRGSYARRQFGQRGPSQMHSPIITGSPIFSRQPLTPRQLYNQPGRFMFPSSRPCPSTPQSLTPKMMQLRFGANSPRPSPFYSPSSNPVQHFRYPGPVTQLHPQHKRLLSQKQGAFQRKFDGWDPYCNLMTTKEREWITRLQMIQLQSENPYLEDYYYQEYYRRIEAKMAEEELGIRGKREPPKLTTPYITKTDSYAPVVHIEGSLGQVAVSTCYSPRRAIGAVHAVQAQGPLEEQKDMRQQRLEVLSKIEKLFIALLEVEETARMKTPVLSEAEERRLGEKTQWKVENIYSQLQDHNPADSGGEFLPFLLVSKGKRLLARLLPFLKQDSALKILRIVTSNLPTLMSRDAEEALPVLYPALRNVIGGLSFSQLIKVLKDLITSEPLSTYESLTVTCQNKFGLSLLYALLSQGEKLLSSGVRLEPSIGDFETWTDTIFQVAGQLSQCSLVEPLILPSNLLTLFCRYLDKRTVHQLKSNIESATGFVALPS